MPERSFAERTPTQKAALLRLAGREREDFLEMSSVAQNLQFTLATPTQKAEALGLLGSSRSEFLELSSAQQERYVPPEIVNPQLFPTQASVIPGDAMSLLGRIGGAVKGAATGGLAGAISGALKSGGSKRMASGTMVMPFAQPQPSLCPDGTVRTPLGCFNPPGGKVRGGGVFVTQGEAVMSRYGAALSPETRSIDFRRCPRGAVLANDGFCYNKSSLNRRDRMWIPARKPLLTGGDLNAITRAHRAATKIKAQTKRLQALGMLQKPKSSKGRAPQRNGFGHPGITVVDT